MKPTLKYSDLSSGRTFVEQQYSGCIGNSTFMGSTTSYWKSGQQAVVNLGAMCTVGQIVTDENNNYDSFSTAKNFFNLDPNAATTGAVNGPYNFTSIPSHRRLGMKRSSMELELTNFHNVDCEITIYVAKCRMNTALDPVEFWQAGLSRENYGVSTADASLTSYPALASGGASMYHYGRIPTKCRSFNNYWKIVGKRAYKLSPGQTQELRINCKHMQSFQRDTVFSLSSSGIRFMKGVSYVVFAVASGQPVRDNAEGSSYQRVTKASGLIGVTMVQKWHINHLKDKRNSDNVYEGVGFTDIPLDKQTFIDVNDDPDTNQEAA